MKERLIAKLETLSNEMQNLLKEKDTLENRLRGIDIRLTQIVGAISELNDILNEEDEQLAKSTTSDLLNQKV